MLSMNVYVYEHLLVNGTLLSYVRALNQQQIESHATQSDFGDAQS